MKKDIAILAAFFSIIVVASAALVIDFYSSSRRATTSEIGHITFKRKTAQRKYFDQPIWEFLYKDSPVYNKDKIRTSTDSLSIIYFDSGLEVELDENTLVYLDMEGDNPVINFSEGSIRTRNTGNDSKTTILIDDQKISLNNANASVTRATNSDIHLEVSEGSAIVTSKQGIVEVNQNSSAVVSSTGNVTLKKQTAVNGLPSPGSYLITDKDKKNIVFSWQNEKQDVSQIEVYNAQTREKTTPAPQRSSDGQYTSAYAPGDYYWQLHLDDGSLTTPKKFTIIKDSPSNTINPEEKKEFYFHTNKPSIFFSWDGTDTATSYKLEISQSPDFTTTAHSIETKEKSITIPSLGEGIWYWRVKNNYSFGGNKEQLVSKTSSFIITHSNNFTSPDLYYPNRSDIISTDYFTRNSLLFNWEQNNDVLDYTFEISENENFDNNLLSKQTYSPYYRLQQKLPAGRYYWRISYINPVTGKREYSNTSFFTISDETQFKSLYPAADSSIPASESVLLSWKDSSQWQSYRIDLSTDKDFKTIEKSYTTTSTSVRVTIRHQGVWYWRVIKLPENGSSDMIVSSFSTLLPLASPYIRIPVNGQVFNMRSNNSLRFVWSDVKDANTYTVNIYDNKEKLVLSRKTTDTTCTINDLTLFNRGDYIVEIFAENSGVTQRISLPVRRLFKIVLPPLAQPDLITRELYYVD